MILKLKKQHLSPSGIEPLLLTEKAETVLSGSLFDIEKLQLQPEMRSSRYETFI